MLEGAREEKGQWFLDATRENLPTILTQLKVKNARFLTLSGIEEDQLQVAYHFELGGKFLHIIVVVDHNKPEINSICKIFPAAELYERELSEMFGIKVKNHPNMLPLFLPDELKGTAPMRKRKQ